MSFPQIESVFPMLVMDEQAPYLYLSPWSFHLIFSSCPTEEGKREGNWVVIWEWSKVIPSNSEPNHWSSMSQVYVQLLVKRKTVSQQAVLMGKGDLPPYQKCNSTFKRLAECVIFLLWPSAVTKFLTFIWAKLENEWSWGASFYKCLNCSENSF